VNLEMTSSKFAANYCDWPDDRDVKHTGNRERWYWVDRNLDIPTLYIPPVPVLKMSATDVSKACEAMNGFSLLDIEELKHKSWDIPYDYCSYKELAYMISQLPEGEIVSCDIETRYTGWDDNSLIVIGHYTDTWGICYMTDSFPKREDAWDQDTLRAMRAVYNDEHVKFLWHNGKFDIGRVAWNTHEQVVPRIDEDTMLLHYACINERKGTHGLKDLAPLYLQAPHWEEELDNIKAQYARKNKCLLKNFRYDLLPRDVLDPYLAMDCYATRKLLDVFRKIAREDGEMCYRNVIRAANVYWRIEYYGMYVDQDHINDLHILLQDELDEALDEVEAAANEAWDPVKYVHDTGAKSMPKYFNLKSPAQLKWLLSTLTGQYLTTTNAEMVEELTEQYSNLKFLQSLMVFRKASKKLDTYVNAMREATCKDGRVRASFNLHGTETGRLSSSGPNMQNIPRDKTIKNIFVAEKGWKLVQFDYSQAELRTLAWFSQDPWLKQVYLDGRDLHGEVALELFGEGYTKEQRNQVKSVNFGVPYGIGPSKLAKDHGLSMAEAIQMINDWFARMPLVKKWLDEHRVMPQKGIEYTTPFGRQRHYIITDKNQYGIGNESMNFPISSVASDLTMLSVCDIDDWIDGKSLRDKVRLVNTVHDSIILEVKDEPTLIDMVIRTGKEIMEQQPMKHLDQIMKMDFPFVADAEQGYKWGALE